MSQSLLNSQPSNHELLLELQTLLIQTMIDEIKWCMEQDPPIPVPAADKNAIIALLKHNEITATPVTQSSLDELRDKLKNTAKGKQMNAITEALGMSDSDIKNMYN